MDPTILEPLGTSRVAANRGYVVSSLRFFPLFASQLPIDLSSDDDDQDDDHDARFHSKTLQQNQEQKPKKQ
ncbi:unnamed protein product [Enterobius vermicularis]|uniref:Uncharacterized protein n=1 Tax=Enterobius vermicularis TaxID=51028 RepID=A0A0N4VN91_ENTVE|nr:unnamed protein product [Enterobius vermicularis]